MNGFDIAKAHFDATMTEAEQAGLDTDAVARHMLNLVVAKYRKTRPLKDIRSELAFVAENCDPDTDFVFMRP